ncbi:MAG: TIGR00266 family protein [Ruminococcaceae bacterium]|nr:TIGR00266 family protein [Lachnospiraceae bacterium]MBE6678298.1 TIGR00266 family protein [Oscillospiraceae bacterium]
MKYEIKGEPFPVVECTVADGETLKCQAGAMAWMTANMEMATKSGGIGKMLGRLATNEALFENNYTAKGGEGMIAFATNVPGHILPIDLSGGRVIIAQKGSFLASEMSVNVEKHFQKKGMGGLLGGEGFIMQKFSGNGVVFLEVDGSVVEYELQPGQTMIVDTGSLAAMDATVKMDVQMVKGLGNMFGGGEGMFNTVLTGPGKIWLQTMPVSGLASSIQPYIVTGR